METLEVIKRNALTAHRQSNSDGKKLLENLFGSDVFNTKVTDRIKTYEDACEELGRKPINEVEMSASGFTHDEITYRKIKTITAALNEGWKPNIMNTTENKHYPYFDVSSSGLVFYGAAYRCSSADAGRASRLCFKTAELAKYAGEQFIQLYQDFIV